MKPGWAKFQTDEDKENLLLQKSDAYFLVLIWLV